MSSNVQITLNPKELFLHDLATENFLRQSLSNQFISFIKRDRLSQIDFTKYLILNSFLSDNREYWNTGINGIFKNGL